MIYIRYRTIAATFLLFCCICRLQAQQPDWWQTYGIIDSQATPDDYHPANQGQVKYLAQSACLELEPHASEEIRALVESFSTNEYNLKPVNIGQLKNTVRPFYDRLIELGEATAYPWSAGTDDDADFAIANIGQVKNMFSFDLTYNGAPSLTMVLPATGCVTADSLFEIEWMAEDLDDDALISLYFDTDDAGADGTQLVSGLSEDSDTQYSWNCSGVPEGTYYVYAIIDDGTNDAQVVYSDGTVQVDHNYAPSVSLSSPVDGAAFTVPAFVQMTAVASDPDGNLRQVDFYVDDVLVGTALSAPYTVKWCDLKEGTHSFYARAIDVDGASSVSATRTIHVDTAPLEAVFAAESSGWKSVSFAGLSVFRRDGAPVYQVYNSSGRGINVQAYDLDWGGRITHGRNFDTFSTRRSNNGSEHAALIDYVDELPDGSLIMMSFCDDAGLTYYQGEDYDPQGFPGWDADEVLHNEWASNVVNLIKSLGSVQIDNYSYQDSWCMIAIKGQGLLSECLSAANLTVTAEVTRAVGSVDVDYDYRNSMTYNHYSDCSTIYANPATVSATCHPGTDAVCAYINDQHRNLLAFSSTKQFVTDGIKFYARQEASQFEHMNLLVNGVATRWEDGAVPFPGEDEWHRWPVVIDSQINQGANNSMRVATDHFGTCDSGDGSIHFDQHDGERGLFILYTTDGDDDDDGLPDQWETYYGLDPMNPYDAQQDLDADGLSNLGEYNCGTDPGYFDTDRDLLSDAFEVGYGLDPVSHIDTNEDQDQDGVINLDELIYSTNPMNGDTDGDGVGDGVEITQGSSPVDVTDDDPPAAEDKVVLKLNVGDYSDSESERYSLSVGHVNYQSSGYGEVSEAEFTFERGKKYTIRINHIGTDPEYMGSPNPDYDYQALITEVSGGRVLIDDPDQILGSWANDGDNFHAAGKTATLYIPKLVVRSFNRGGLGADINETYPLNNHVTSAMESLYENTMEVDLLPAGVENLYGTDIDFSISSADSHGATIGTSTGTLTPGRRESGTITLRASLSGYSDIYVESPFVIKAIPLSILNTVKAAGTKDDFYSLFVRQTFESSGGSLAGIRIKEDIKNNSQNIFKKSFKPDLGKGGSEWHLDSSGQMIIPDCLSIPHFWVEEAVQNNEFPNFSSGAFNHTDVCYQFYGYYDPIVDDWIPCTSTYAIDLQFYRSGSDLWFRSYAYGVENIEPYAGVVPE